MFGPEYPKINSLWKRDQRGRVLEGDFARPAFEYLYRLPWYWTEKVDGTNIRIHWDGEQVTIGGRSDNAQTPGFLLAALEQYRRPDLFRSVFGSSTDVTLYGEGYGARIQKGGGNYRDDAGFILFDVRVGSYWLERANMTTVAIEMELDTVPYIGEFSPSIAWEVIKDAGFQSHWPKVSIEGLVGKPRVQIFDRQGHRVITKIKVKDWTDLARDL